MVGWFCNLDLLVDQYRENMAQDWVVYTVFLPTQLLYILLVPGLLDLATDSFGSSRVHRLCMSIIGWLCVLVYRLHPHEYTNTREELFESTFAETPFTQWPTQAAVDAFIFLMVGNSARHLVCSFYRKSKFYSYVSIRPDPRWVYNFAAFIAVYLLIVGTSELAWLFGSNTVDEHLEQTAWDWPPSRVDCSKVYSVLFCSSKILMAVWLLGCVWLLRVSTKGQQGSNGKETPLAETIMHLDKGIVEMVASSQEGIQLFTRRVRIGIALFFVTQVILSVIETYQGTEYLWQYATLLTFNNTSHNTSHSSTRLGDVLLVDGSESGTGNKMLHRRFSLRLSNSTDSWEHVSPICLSTNSHMIESMMGIGCIVLLLAWHFIIREREKAMQR